MRIPSGADRPDRSVGLSRFVSVYVTAKIGPLATRDRTDSETGQSKQFALTGPWTTTQNPILYLLFRFFHAAYDGFGAYGTMLFGRELSECAALRAAEGHDRNHQIAVEFEIAKKCLVGSRTRMPMTANSLGIVIRNEAAFHFFMAIGADGCLFHLSFLVVFAVSVTWLGSDAASGC